MKSGNPQKRISNWVAALPIVIILVVKIVQLYLIDQGWDDVADIIGIGIPLMLVGGIILSLYLWAILGTPPIDPLTAEKMEVGFSFFTIEAKTQYLISCSTSFLQVLSNLLHVL